MLRDKWIQALRSGDYYQITGAFFGAEDGSNFACALGVLFKVAGVCKNDALVSISSGKRIAKDIICEMFDNVEQRHPYEAMNIISEIIYMNDGIGLTFSEIADYIEKAIPSTKNARVVETQVEENVLVSV